MSASSKKYLSLQNFDLENALCELAPDPELDYSKQVRVADLREFLAEGTAANPDFPIVVKEEALRLLDNPDASASLCAWLLKELCKQAKNDTDLLARLKIDSEEFSRIIEELDDREDYKFHWVKRLCLMQCLECANVKFDEIKEGQWLEVFEQIYKNSSRKNAFTRAVAVASALKLAKKLMNEYKKKRIKLQSQTIARIEELCQKIVNERKNDTSKAVQASLRKNGVL